MENVGVLLRGIKREEIERGQVPAAGHHCRTPFESEVYILSKDEGGRHTRSFSKATVRSSTSVLLT